MLMLLYLLQIALAAPTLAIADLANHTGDTAFDGAGPGVAGILVSRFVGTGEIEVVERDALASLLSEQQLTVDRLTDARTAARAGRLLGADYLVMGELFSVRLPSISIALRVIDTETAEVVVSKDVVGQVGEDGQRFFELIDALSTEILAAMDLTLTDGHRLSEIEQRELNAVLRYGEDLLRVNLDHPMSLYRESDRDFDRDSTVRRGWAIYDKRGVPVPMPEFARRTGDRATQLEFLERGRRLRRSARINILLTSAYGAAGLGAFIGGGIAGDDLVKNGGAAVAGVAVIHLGANLIGQALKRSASKRPGTYYTPAEADRRIQTYNRSLQPVD